jgi:hypothetical protein
VESVSQAAMSSARDQIVAEVGNLVLTHAKRLGDSTLTAKELAALFDSAPVQSDARVLEHVIFGLTPLRGAASEIASRFERMGTAGYDQRTLLVISDGDPTDGDPRPYFAAMRRAGVNIVACFVTDADIADPRNLVGTPVAGWPKGANLMWEIASPLDESSAAAHYLLAHGWSIEQGAKFFVQVNHSDVLKEFVRVSASYFSSQTSTLLPRGE